MVTDICTTPGCENRKKARGMCVKHYGLWWRGEHPRESTRRTDDERFWSKVEKTDTCWKWTASTNTHGYGRFRLNGTKVCAHRYAYEKMVGPIPDGMFLDHICHTPGCVRPSHLRPATPKQNAEHLKPRIGTKSGYRGVTWNIGNKKWEANVRSNGRRHYLGLFDDPAEAAEAARLKRLELFTHNNLDHVGA